MRTTTTAQDTALAALDRATHVRVKIDDADGTAQDLSSLQGEDFLDQVVIDVQTDVPISACTISLRREVALHSVSPLRTDSLINRDSSGAYAAFLNPNRDVTVEVATMLAGETPASGDWVLIWEGITDEVDWGGKGSTCRVHARDPMSRLNDTFMDTSAPYGDDAGTKDVEDYIQDILTAEISSPAVTLAFTATSFPIAAKDVANVTVLEACQAVADLIGWNLHWRWNTSAAAFRLTLWQPDRSNTTADYTFGQDDFYVIPSVGLALSGIRNVGEIDYITTAGTVVTATETRTVSVNLYSERFIRIDARETSIVTATQASDMLDAILDDLEEPAVQQQIEVPFFWPIELGDLYAFSSNTYYDSEQKFAAFGFRHILSNSGPKRTLITVSGKPSGGYERWHARETGSRDSGVPRGGFRIGSPSVEVTFDANGQATVSAVGGGRTRTMYVTVGDGTDPADPTVATNDGTITGRSGVVATTQKITTGNAAHVKVIAIDMDGTPSAVASIQQARRIGPFHKDATTRSTSNTGSDATLETITIPANVLGLNGGLRLTAVIDFSGTTDLKNVKVKWGGNTIVSETQAAGYISDLWIEMLLFNNASASSQVIVARTTEEGSSPAINFDRTTQSVDTTSAVDILITGQLNNGADTVDLEMSHLEFIGTD